MRIPEVSVKEQKSFDRSQVKISLFLGLLVPLWIFKANCTLKINVIPTILKDSEHFGEIPLESIML